MSKERTISKVIVQTGGLKGLILEGTKKVYRENKLQLDGFRDTVRHPIHLELEDKIGDLRFSVLEICGLSSDNSGLSKEEKKNLLYGCEIESIEFEQGVTGWFKIKAKSRVFDTKYQTIKTPKVDSSDGYDRFDTVMKIIEDMIEEIHHYENKTKVISNEELAISFVRHGKSGGVDMQMLEEMSLEEKTTFIEEMCLKNGLLVNLMPMEEDDEEIEEKGEDLTTNFAPTDEKKENGDDKLWVDMTVVRKKVELPEGDNTLDLTDLQLEPLPEKAKAK